MPSRYVTAAPENARSEPARSDSTPTGEPRYRLMRLCECPDCEGRGSITNKTPRYLYRCQNCRGEGKKLDEIARCDTPADVGVALVTLATEGEFDGCPFGCIDTMREDGDKWLIRPWMASPRNVSDAGRLLNQAKRR